MPFKDSLEGTTHSYNDGCGEPEHNKPINPHIQQHLDKFDELYKSFNWLVKYSDFTQDYRCTDDCKQSGCPGHTATFSISHATDTYSIDWGNKEKIYLDNAQMALLLQFAEKISEQGKQFLQQALQSTWNAAVKDTVERIRLKEVKMKVLDYEASDFAIGVRDGFNSAVADQNELINKLI